MSPEALEYYQFGACQVFAATLSARTGWPIEYLSDLKYPWCGCDHAVVQHPSGGLIDATGWCTRDQLIAKYLPKGHEANWTVVSVSEVQKAVDEFVELGNFEETALLDHVESDVQCVLEQINLA